MYKIEKFDITQRELVKNFFDLDSNFISDNDHLETPTEMKCAEYSNQNEFYKYSASLGIIIYNKNNECVCKMIAVIDPLKNGIGQFSYFNAKNDIIAVKTLFSEAEKWFQTKNIKEVIGPMNQNIYHQYRFMTKGFETDVHIGEPRNHSYYSSLIENAGFRPESTWKSFDLSKKQCQFLKDSIKENLKEAEENYKIRNVNIENLKDELIHIYPHALKIFSENYGYTEIKMPEFIQQFMALKPFLIPGSFIVAENQKNEVVGFVYGYLDYAPNLKNQDFKTPPKRFIFHTFGVKKEFRKTQLTYELAYHIVNNCEAYFDLAIGALAKEGKSFYDKIGSANREYTIFKKVLS